MKRADVVVDDVDDDPDALGGRRADEREAVSPPYDD
jgi:hypothetical protein